MKRRPDARASAPVIIALILLAVATMVLSFLALKTSRAEVPNAGQTPGYVPISHDQQPPADQDEGEGDSSGDQPEQPQVTVPPVSRVLGVQDGDVAYRAVTGPCPETQFTVETTWDAGMTWSPQTDTAGFGLSAVQRILVGDDGYVSVVASSQEDCDTLIVAQSYEYGTNWALVEDGQAITWHITPGNAATAHSPQIGTVDLPCEAASLSTLDSSNAAILCTDGRLASTLDAGANWAISDPLNGASALGSAGGAYLLTQANTPNCPATLVSRVNSGLAVETSTCLEQIPAGDIAVAGSSAGNAWLWAGDAIMRSFDGGVNWQ